MALTFKSGIDTPKGHVCSLKCSCGHLFVLDPGVFTLKELVDRLLEHFGVCHDDQVAPDDHIRHEIDRAKDAIVSAALDAINYAHNRESRFAATEEFWRILDDMDAATDKLDALEMQAKTERVKGGGEE